MHEEKEVSLPVVYETRRGRKEAWLGTTSATLRIVAPAEAPVVIEGFSKDSRDVRHDVTFRAYDGRLWEPLRDPAGRGIEATLERLAPEAARARPEGWQDMLVASPKGRHLVLNHPLLSARARDVGARYGNWVGVETREKNREYREAAEEVRRAARRVIVVGDEVLKPSWGPLLGLDWYESGGATRLCALVEDERSSIGVQIAPSMLDADRLIEWLDAEGSRSTLDGWMPTVLSEEGWSRQAVVDGCFAREVDREAWDLLLMFQHFSLNGRHRRLLEASVDLREAMVWAREGRESVSYSINAEWLDEQVRADLGATAGMVEPFKRCLEEYEKVMPHTRSIAGWHRMVDLAERQCGITFDAKAFDRAMGGQSWS